MPNENHYPNVEITFLHEMVMSSNKYKDTVVTGGTTSYILKGEGYIGKRMLTLRETENGSVPFEKATELALRTGCLSELLNHLENKHNFKDGGYTDSK